MKRAHLTAAIVVAGLLALSLGGCSGASRSDPFALCGNGTLDPGEQCDEGTGNSDTGDCLTTCVRAICGDNFVYVAQEACDGTNLSFQGCQSLGFAAGVLGCTPSCQFDTTACGVAFTPTVVATRAPTVTPTPPGRCGNGVIESGETCTACPTDCVVGACTPGEPLRTITVTLSVPAGEDASSVSVLVGYRSTSVALPGMGSSAASRVKNRPSNAIVAVNDLDYALRVNVTRSARIVPGTLFTVDFDSCQGAAPPTASDLACSIEGCASSFGAVDGCACSAVP